MSDQNGDCFEVPHSKLLIAAGSNHEDLKDFLLDSENVLNDYSQNSCGKPNVLDAEENHSNTGMSDDDIPSETQNNFDSCSYAEDSSKDSVVNNNLSSEVNSRNLSVISNGDTGVDMDHSSENNGDFSASSVDSGDDGIKEIQHSDIQNDCNDSSLSQTEQGVFSSSDCETSSANCTPSTSENYDASVMDVGDSIENGYIFEEEEEEEVPTLAKLKESSQRGRKRRGTDSSKSRSTGPSKRKKQPVRTYQSQISPDQNGIKLKIKMSSGVSVVQRSSKKKDGSRKKRRSRKSSSTEDEDNETVGVGDIVKKVRFKDPTDSDSSFSEPKQQSVWGHLLPEKVIQRIFEITLDEENSLPFLFRMGQICDLWRKVSATPSLWQNVDFSGSWMKKQYKNTETFKWLCEHRLTETEELNMGGWNYLNIQIALDYICRFCTELQGLNLSGWEGLNADHLRHLITNCSHLERLDLSSINRESNSRGAVSLNSLTYLAQTMGERLTHLVLADNELRGLTQIITAIATHCPNLQLLDLSNVRCHTTASLSIEKLQEGCTKLRVLRMTNSCVTPAAASLREQATAPGFPALEELSVAGPGTDRVTVTHPLMDDGSIERILKSSHKLRLLDVRGCLRITDSSLVRVPAWDLEHLFLSGCYVTRLNGSGLELIVQKWSHSLIEVDLAWSTATEALDLAVSALAERGADSPLRVLNLCGSSVSLAPVKEVLTKCPLLISLNLSSCRALPRGMKRLYEGEQDISELRNSFDEKQEAKQQEEDENEKEQSPRNNDSSEENNKEKQDLASGSSPAKDGGGNEID